MPRMTPTGVMLRSAPEPRPQRSWPAPTREDRAFASHLCATRVDPYVTPVEAASTDERQGLYALIYAIAVRNPDALIAAADELADMVPYRDRPLPGFGEPVADLRPPQR